MPEQAAAGLFAAKVLGVMNEAQREGIPVAVIEIGAIAVSIMIAEDNILRGEEDELKRRTVVAERIAGGVSAKLNDLREYARDRANDAT